MSRQQNNWEKTSDPRSPANLKKHELMNKIWMAKQAIKKEQDAKKGIAKNIQKYADHI